MTDNTIYTKTLKKHVVKMMRNSAWLTLLHDINPNADGKKYVQFP